MEEENEPSIKVGSDRAVSERATVADLAIAAPVARNTRFSVSFHRPPSLARSLARSRRGRVHMEFKEE